MAKTLVIHPERCTACRAWELACSMKHHGAFNPSRSRIIRTRHAFTVRPDQPVAGAITWGRILRDNRLAGAVGQPQ
jgi:Fe-S-cluster-containing dehydrogenase component